MCEHDFRPNDNYPPQENHVQRWDCEVLREAMKGPVPGFAAAVDLDSPDLDVTLASEIYSSRLLKRIDEFLHDPKETDRDFYVPRLDKLTTSADSRIRRRLPVVLGNAGIQLAVPGYRDLAKSPGSTLVVGDDHLTVSTSLQFSPEMPNSGHHVIASIYSFTKTQSTEK